MTRFSFHQPKKTISNILFIFGVLTLVITLLAFVSFISWSHYPKFGQPIANIDLDFYGKRIESLYEIATSNNDIEQQYTHYLKLYKELEDISILNRYYSYRQESARFLIQYYLKNNLLTQAMNIADKWEKLYPFDFEGKYTYIKVLSTLDKKKATQYYKKFYDDYKDIADIRNHYITFLIDEKKYNRALSVDNNGQSHSAHLPRRYNIPFRVYYRDGADGFSQKQSIRYDSATLSFDEEVINYSIDFSKKFNQLKGLRFDIEQPPLDSVVYDFKAFVKGEHSLQQPLLISNTNNLTITKTKTETKAGTKNRVDKNHYIINGMDPHFNLVVPEQLKNYSGQLNAHFSIKIDRSNNYLKEITHNPQWQFFFAGEVAGKNEFTEQKSFHFILKKQANNYIAEKDLVYKNINRLRIDFPSLLSLRIKNFNLIINKQLIFTKEQMSSSSNLLIKPKFLEVNAEDPFVIFDLEKSIDIESIKIEIIFFGENNE